MNLQHPNDPWSKLVHAAREARDDRDASAPFGFATRVAALGLGARGPHVSVLERFALRAVSVASLLAVASVAWNYNAITVPIRNAEMAAAAETEMAVTADDAVAIVLDFAAD